MNKKTFMIQAVLSACCIITSCSSDTVNGDNEYFTHGQITYVQEDESKIFFFDNQDGTAMVTYNRKYPIQLNDNNQAKLTTYAGEVTIPETFAVEGKTYRVTSVDEMAFANNTRFIYQLFFDDSRQHPCCYPGYSKLLLCSMQEDGSLHPARAG